jgi:hypothetical protein
MQWCKYSTVGYARGGGLRSLRIGCNGVNIVHIFLSSRPRQLARR